MPQRRLPKSAPARLKALSAAKQRKDAVPAPLVIPFTAATITRLDTFYAAYKLKVQAMEAALVSQAGVTGTVTDARPTAEAYLSSFFSALQYAVRRKLFSPAIRAHYGLAVSDENLPRLKSESDIIFWGDKAATGEAARVAAGGVPITFPSIAEVNTAVSNFANPNIVQANAKSAYDAAQEAVEADAEEADKLILKMWNEIETAFDEGDKPSMRRKAREWGVVYVPNPGEVLSPDEFSIQGKIIDIDTGAALTDAAVLVDGTDIIVLTDGEGKYLIPLLAPAKYKVNAYKPGYDVKEMKDVNVEAGAITSLDIALLKQPATGSVSGTVKFTGMGAPAKVVVEGTTLQADTDPMGNYTITDVPVGSRIITAKLNSSGSVQSQTITISDGANTTVDFNF